GPAHPCPDIGNIASPNLIGLLYIELPIEKIRDIQVRLIRLLVGVAWRLCAHQPQLLHPPAGAVAAQRRSGLRDHFGNAAGSGRAVAGGMRLNNLIQQLLFSLTGSSIPVTPGPVATAMHPKHLTQVLHRVALFKSLDYRELLRESDIKRAVAFFNISFSSSTRRSWRFSS